MLFPSRVKRIIFCFVYSEDYHPSFISPYLEEESLQPPYVVDVDPIALPQPIPKDEICIQIPSESDHACDLEEIELVSKPAQISAPLAIISEPDQQLTILMISPQNFSLRLDKGCSNLSSYPSSSSLSSIFFEYLPHFTGENHVSAEKHLEAFENFIDNFSNCS
jgi:hypothetical protein